MSLNVERANIFYVSAYKGLISIQGSRRKSLHGMEIRNVQYFYDDQILSMLISHVKPYLIHKESKLVIYQKNLWYLMPKFSLNSYFFSCKHWLSPSRKPFILWQDSPSPGSRRQLAWLPPEGGPIVPVEGWHVFFFAPFTLCNRELHTKARIKPSRPTPHIDVQQTMGAWRLIHSPSWWC